MTIMRLTVVFDREDALQRAKALALETLAGLANIGETKIDDAIHFDAA